MPQDPYAAIAESSGSDPYAAIAAARPPSAASRLGTNFLSGLGVTSDEEAKNFFGHPLDTVIKSFEAQGQLAKKARDAYRRGDYMEALQHGLNYLVPFVGQQTDQAGTQLKEGDIAGGIGRTLGAAVPIVAGSPEVRAAASDAASATATTGARAVRATAKGVNTALAKAPATVGTAVGAAAGAASRIPYGAEIGAGVGSVVGKELLPKVRIPGEGFGLPNRVQGGPASAPQLEPPASAAPVTPEPAAAPATTPAAAATPAAAPEPAAPIRPGDVERQLNDALGGKPLQRNVSLKNQIKTAVQSQAKLPEGFTPVDSSALKGYKYNPDAQEFESITTNGQRYVHGDVSPDQAAAFEAADSKGKAWNDLRSSSPLVAKVVDGRRVAAKPPVGMRSIVIDPQTGQPEFSDVVEAKKSAAKTVATPKTPKPAASAAPPDDDLTGILQETLKQLQRKKAVQSR